MNRGKQYEKIIHEFLEESGYDVVRLYDTMYGYSGVANPCDFVAYKNPNCLFIECKCTHNGTLNLKTDIRPSQWDGLMKRKDTKGALAGVLVWFVRLDKTLFVPIQTLLKLREAGEKSLSPQNVKVHHHFTLEGERKKIFFKYNSESFNTKVDILLEDLWVK